MVSPISSQRISVHVPIFVSMFDQLKRTPVIIGMSGTVNGMIQPTAQITDDLRGAMVLPVVIKNLRGQAIRFGAFFEAVRTASDMADAHQVFMGHCHEINEVSRRLTNDSFRLEIHGRRISYTDFFQIVHGTGETDAQIRSTLAKLEDFAKRRGE